MQLSPDGTGLSVSSAGRVFDVPGKLSHDFGNEAASLHGYFSLLSEGCPLEDLGELITTLKPLRTYRERLSQDARFHGHLDQLSIDSKILIDIIDPFVALINTTYFQDGVFIGRNMDPTIFFSCFECIDAILKEKKGYLKVVQRSVAAILPLLDYSRTEVPVFDDNARSKIVA